MSSESPVPPFTGEKCLRSNPRREEAKGTICRAHEVGKQKARTAFQSVYNKVKGQHAAVWASLRATLYHRNEMLLPSPKGRPLQEPPDGRAQTGTGT